MRAPSSVEETGGLALRRAAQRRDAIAAASGGLRTALGKRTVFWQRARSGTAGNGIQTVEPLARHRPRGDQPLSIRMPRLGQHFRVVPCSTTRPAYITASRSAIWAITRDRG